MEFEYTDKGSRQKMAVLAVAALIVIVFVVAPSITGFFSYVKAKGDQSSAINDLKTSLKMCSDDVDGLKASKESMQISLDDYRTNLTSCQQTREELSKQLSDSLDKAVRMQNDLTACSMNLGVEKDKSTACQTNLQNANKNYDELARYSGNKICCAAKIYTPSIAYYNIQNNQIACSSDSGIALTC